MTKEVAEKIVKGITDKIECNTVDIDDWAEFWGFTREEYEEFLDVAIKALETASCIKEKCAYCPHCENCDVDDETLEIKALEQQPCKDCISREDAINAAIDAVDEWDGGCNTSRATMISHAIKDLPPVTPSYNSVKTELDHVIDQIIIRIEQTRDKDKLCEYPYNRCIDIVKEVLGDD